MSNEYGQSDADPAGNQPTQQFWAGPDAPTAIPAWGSQPGVAGPPGPGHTGHPAPGLQEQPRKDHRKALHWTAGLLVAALLAGGGTVAGMRLADHSSPGTSSGATTGQPGSAGTAQQGALLNETLSDASSPGALTAGATLTGGTAAAAGGAAAGAAAKAPACARARHVSRVARRAGLPRLARRVGIGAARCRLARRRVFAFFLLRGVDGQFTIQTKKGTKTLAYERGVIQSVDRREVHHGEGQRRDHLDLGPGQHDGRPRPSGKARSERPDRGNARLGGRPGGPGHEGRKAHSCPASAASLGVPILHIG